MRNRAPQATAGTQGTQAGAAAALPLTFKGFVACLLLLLYGALMAVFVVGQLRALDGERALIDQLQLRIEALKRANLAVSSVRRELRDSAASGTAPGQGAIAEAPYALEAAERALAPWEAQLQVVTEQLRAVKRRHRALAEESSRAALLELGEAWSSLAREIDQESERTNERRLGLMAGVRREGDRIVLEALALGLGGMLVFGGVAAVFFARLARELRAVGGHAKAIVSGFRGEPLEVTRRDEVGVLARDVNQMAAILVERERELALAREQRAHREKMAALGAMAKVLSHEIGNPLAAISAVVQHARENAGPESSRLWQPDLLLEQTSRIARITRQIAEFSVPERRDAGVADVAGMVATVCEFMQFDPRFGATRIQSKVAAGLPMLRVVPDELAETLMNLLLLSRGQEGAQAPPALAIEAEAGADLVVLRLTGGRLPEDMPSLARTRVLVDGMGGRLEEPRPGTIELTLPAASAGGL